MYFLFAITGDTVVTAAREMPELGTATSAACDVWVLPKLCKKRNPYSVLKKPTEEKTMENGPLNDGFCHPDAWLDIELRNNVSQTQFPL